MTFNNSSEQPELAEMWRSVIRKSWRVETQAAAASTARPASMKWGWGGGGQALAAAFCDPDLLEVPFPGTLVSAHIFAGDANGEPVAVTATIDLRLTSVLTFGASTRLAGVGALPALTLESASNLDITGWQTNLLAADAIVGRLLTFVGTATWIALVLSLRPTEVGLGVSTVVDSAGDTLVDSNGNIIVNRG